MDFLCHISLLKSCSSQSTLPTGQEFLDSWYGWIPIWNFQRTSETMSIQNLDQILEKFWLEIRQQNGNKTKFTRKTKCRRSNKAIRAGVQRIFKKIRGENFDIINDTLFWWLKQQISIADWENYKLISEEDVYFLHIRYIYYNFANLPRSEIFVIRESLFLYCFPLNFSISRE